MKPITEDETSDDLVMAAVNSVGFELDKRVWVEGQEYVCFRPKRKQTPFKQEVRITGVQLDEAGGLILTIEGKVVE